MLEDVINIDSCLAKAWIMPIIQGYVEIKQCKTFFKENQKYEVRNLFIFVINKFLDEIITN